REFPLFLFEHLPTLIWRSGPDSQCSYFNQTWLDFTGRSLAEEIGDGWTLGVHPEDFDRCVGTYLQHFAARTPFEMEYRLRRHDGEYRWILDTGRPIVTPSGEFAGYIGSCLDITDRRNTEAALKERENRMTTLLASMGEGVIMRDAGGDILMHNAAAERILGLTASDLARWNVFSPFLAYVNEEGVPVEPAQLPAMQAIASGEPRSGVIGIDRPDGQRRWLLTNCVPLFNNGEKQASAVVTTIADITERRLHEEQLRLAWTVFRNSVEAILVTDASHRIISVNKAFCEVTGYSEAEAIGATPRLLKSGLHDRPFYNAIWAAIDTAGFWQGEIYDRRKDGSLYPAAMSISAVHDRSGRLTHYVSVFSDITERKASEARIAYLAQHDALTGLPNRALLHDRLEQALAAAARHDRRLAVLFLDLDRFKTINDSLGHLIGDRLLKGVAERISACIRETDTVSRQGGDEFLIVLTDFNIPDDAARVAEKILDRITAPFDLDGHQLGTSFSIGIALYPDDGTTPETLMKNADTAMYHAKESGRNTYRFFDEA
ncbi:MAG TPA: diguanylate cyclase, partial [Rhodocyclaceae bacterium]|nr:diguanylate cyclase [Rhodocyclaceae bacterium]